MTSKDIIASIQNEYSLEGFENLKKIDFEYGISNNQYVVDDEDNIIQLGLKNAEVHKIQNLLSFFRVRDLTNIQYLCLLNSSLSDIDGLEKLSALRSLLLVSSEVLDMSPLAKMPHLEVLNLSGSNIKNYQVISTLTGLRTLWLTGCTIDDFTFLKELTNLERLSLIRTGITSIEVIKGITKLKTLALDGNEIKYLPEWITDYDANLTMRNFGDNRFSFIDNPLETPPPEIVQRGKDAIRAYFKSLKGKTTKLNEVKILLMGEGLAGKTSLLKRLQGLPFDKDESQTHGINVVSINPNEIDQLKKYRLPNDCQLHIWDFGGQEIMHASHQFFMSERSVYILILDSRTDSKKHHWLRHIEKFGGDSPIIVVMNKMDENPNYNIQQKSINQNFPAIKNRFHKVSCSTDQGLDELTKTLSNTIQQTSLFGSTISVDWMNVKEELAQQTVDFNYIDRNTFLEICEKHDVNDQTSQQTLLQYLHDLGIVLHFKKLDLANIYVLDPHWVTVGVYKIINSARIKDGMLQERDLDFILNEEKIKKEEYDPAKDKNFSYNQEEQAYLLKIMMQFELCYEFAKDKGQYIIPDLLPKEIDLATKFENESIIQFVLEYDYLPSQVIARLMIHFKNEILNRQQWKYGMVLENQEFNTRAQVLASESEKTITIQVEGPDRYKQRYLSIIRHQLQNINTEFENLRIKEYIPLPGYPGYAVKYKELLGYEISNRDEYFHGELQKPFSVSKLLDSVISKEERDKDKSMGDISIKIDNRQEQHAKQESSQVQKVSQEVRQDVKQITGLLENLFEDVREEIEIEVEDPKEQKRFNNELAKTEKAFAELEEASTNDEKELQPATKNRLTQFADNLQNPDSRIRKALSLVENGIGKAQQLGKVYNKFAPFFVLPSIPDMFLNKE